LYEYTYLPQFGRAGAASVSYCVIFRLQRPRFIHFHNKCEKASLLKSFYDLK
jgi:hypothetical protein